MEADDRLPHRSDSPDPAVPSMKAQLDGQVAELLDRSARGDSAARDRLLLLLYAELRHIASALVGRDRRASLQATELVHEAYLKLAGSALSKVRDRAHFMHAAARAMRCILIDHRRASAVRPRTLDAGDEGASPLDRIVVTFEERAIDLSALDRALERLSSFDPRMAKAVELRFFAGQGMQETAELLGMSLRQLEREWQATRAWLLKEVS